MRLGANNTYAGFTSVNGGTLTVDGAQPQSPVNVNSGTLGGSGAVGSIYMNGSSAVVAPGDGAPGILTCGNVNAGITASGVLRMELNGTTVGSGYDQLNVIWQRSTLPGLHLQCSGRIHPDSRRRIHTHQQRRQGSSDRPIQRPAFQASFISVAPFTKSAIASAANPATTWRLRCLTRRLRPH